jgi:hypothetical protein
MPYEKTGTCPECKHQTVVYPDGRYTCVNCEWEEPKDITEHLNQIARWIALGRTPEGYDLIKGLGTLDVHKTLHEAANEIQALRKENDLMRAAIDKIEDIMFNVQQDIYGEKE